ncbi:hypothetical protein AK812_SmicGene2870 [Symbiodinium microadriaticum]|uniref:Transmembrane protein n=1 Tax=Symbiodinium microadriaticum TaxID=2951 RepID=A0A1Q9F0E5_SYMMI|nr:hypothetical protein AK812_SmicGene2870 [Symbiodinium microadriaticum]
MWRRSLLAGALAVVSVGDETSIGSLDFLDCAGEGFDPAWASFKAALPFPLSPSTPLSERAVSEARVRESNAWCFKTLCTTTPAFTSWVKRAALVPDAAVCMGAMVRKRLAFLILAFTMTQTKQVLPSHGNRVGGCTGFTFWRSPRLPPSPSSALHRRPETQTRTSTAVTSGISERWIWPVPDGFEGALAALAGCFFFAYSAWLSFLGILSSALHRRPETQTRTSTAVTSGISERWIWPVPDGFEGALAALAGCFFFAYSAWLSFLGFCAGFPAAALWTFAIGYAIGLLCGIFLYKFDSGIQVASGAGVLLGVVAAKFVYAFFILGHTLPWMF